MTLDSPTRSRLSPAPRVIGCTGLLLLTALLGPRVVSAQPDTILDYEVRYGPLQIMAMRTTTHVDDATYRTSTEVRTVGIAALLFPWQASSSTNGVRAADSMHPQHFRSTGEYRGERRVSEVDYDGSGTVSTRLDPPPEADDRDPVDPALQRETIDPLTAGVAAVMSGCRGTFPVFDGRRRYDLVLSDLGDADTPRSRHTVYTGRARHCRVSIQALGGFRRSAPYLDERPSQIDAWVASPQPGMVAVPVYLELSAPRGTLAIHLAATEPLAAPPPETGAAPQPAQD
jgi:hypothetical protein